MVPDLANIEEPENMSEYGHRWETSISTNTMYTIPERIGNGLQAVVFCNHGTGRSKTLAEILSKQPDKKAIHIVGSLGNLAVLSHEEMQKQVGYLKDVPYIFLTIDPSEEKLYKKVIDEINRIRSTPAVSLGSDISVSLRKALAIMEGRDPDQSLQIPVVRD
jgi:hypothetical protein